MQKIRRDVRGSGSKMIIGDRTLPNEAKDVWVLVTFSDYSVPSALPGTFETSQEEVEKAIYLELTHTDACRLISYQ